MIYEKRQQYRQKHKRCRYCRGFDTMNIPCGLTSRTFYKCVIKDKFINPKLLRFKGCLCKYYIEGD